MARFGELDLFKGIEELTKTLSPDDGQSCSKLVVLIQQYYYKYFIFNLQLPGQKRNIPPRGLKTEMSLTKTISGKKFIQVKL